MKILVVGSGGREHAICSHISRSSGSAVELFCADGNAGIGETARLVPISPWDVSALRDFAVSESIDLTFVGGETALAEGIVDLFKATGKRIVGPDAVAARLESSKVYAKEFMKRYGIPTAGFEVGHSISGAKSILERHFSDVGSVIKADGLAAGKGVVVCPDLSSALDALAGIEEIAGAAACERIVIEERLEGREVSLLLFTDGQSYSLMPPVRDHKRLLDGDAGPNTGGMGTLCDDALLTQSELDEIEEKIVRPTVLGFLRDGISFNGILFIGLMLTSDGPKVLEFNVRFGDPETQSLLMRLDTPLLHVLEAIESRRLSEVEVNWKSGVSATVVLAASGYPYNPIKGDEISGLTDISQSDGLRLFHAGTTTNHNGRIVTAGGRVLGVSTFGSTVEEALAAAYSGIEKISFEGMQFRKDIGR